MSGKIMSRKLVGLLAALLALSLVAAACGNDDDGVAPEPTAAPEPPASPEPTAAAEPEPEPAEPGTVVEVAVGAGSFPTLVAAVQAAGLVDVLSGEGPFTVFAPTEEAFASALAALGMSAEELLADTELLASVLTYHVLPLAAPAEVVLTLDGQSVTTVNGADIDISIDGGAVMVNDATVVATDIAASNGIIHVIDTVLLPPSPEPEPDPAAPEPEPAAAEPDPAAPEPEPAAAEPDPAAPEPEPAAAEPDPAAPEPEPEPEGPDTVVDVAIASGNFPTLVKAIEAAGLVETLSGEGPFTVFAPTEEAFAAALEELGMPMDVLLGTPPLIRSVLTYHVLPVEAPAEVVLTLDGESVTTVHGADIAISIDDGTVKLNDEATVVETDIFASNGIIHVIDTVLIRSRE